MKEIEMNIKLVNMEDEFFIDGDIDGMGFCTLSYKTIDESFEELIKIIKRKLNE